MGKLRIYNASAGSGKTFSLVREYLVLLFSSPRNDAYREILAVTFTNKAAWEMKQRILRYLQDISAGEDPNGIATQIRQKTGISLAELQRRAAEILESIFNDYSAFAVGTIDSFTTRLVRSFSHELHLPVGFDIVVDAEDILYQAVDMLLIRAGEDGKLSDMLVDFVLHNVDKGNSWDITSLLLSGARIGQGNAGEQALEKLSALRIEDYLDLRRRLIRYKAETEKELSLPGEQACRIIYQQLGSDKILAGGANGVASVFRKAAQGRILDIDPEAAAPTKFLAGKCVSSSATAEQKRAVMAHYETLCAQLEDILNIVRKKGKAYAYADMVLVPLSKMSVVSRINQEVDQLKQRGNVMLLSEFNDIVSRHLRDEPIPFIYEKIGERYRHYFIDEFQDTSVLQWNNLRELVYNQLAQDGSALLVGDAKQAIYRWRGGDTRQFIDLCGRGGGLPSEQYEVEDLTKNYRSAGVIVDFTNAFFHSVAPLAGNSDYRQMYEKGNNQESCKPGQGFVSIRDIPGKTVEERLEPTLQAILEEVCRVREDGYTYRDIAVIYRSNREGSQIAEYLTRHGIPTRSSESLLIASSQAVRVLAAMLRVSVFPDDLQARATIADFMQDSGAFDGEDPDAEKYACITARASVFFTRMESFSRGRFVAARAFRMPLYETLEYLATAFSLWGCGQDAYVTAFLDMVADFVKNVSASPVAFLEHWDAKKSSAGIPAGQTSAAVLLLTIHKAKGLEYPVTIVPFANWKISDREEIWIDIPQQDERTEALKGLPVALVPLSGVKKYGLDELYAPYQEQISLDNMNLLYVALTRAIRQLHIITATDTPGRTVAEIFQVFLGEADVRNDDIYTYSIGRREGPCAACQQGDEYEMTQGAGSVWREKLRVDLDWKKVWSVPRTRAVEWGNCVHRVLSDIVGAQDTDAAVERAFAAGWFPPEEKEDIRRAVRAVVEHPRLKSYFLPPWQAENEREMMTDRGDILRPDRVCLDGMRAVVADYKTGAPRAEHGAQVLQYAKVLTDMGYRVEECLLVYLNKGEIEVVAC